MAALNDLSLRLAPAPQGQKLSQVLEGMLQGGSARIAVGDLAAALGDRGFAPLMVILGLPNLFMFVPGSSVFTGLPLILLSLQLLSGRGKVWMPETIACRSIERAAFERLARIALPRVVRAEKLARPRCWPRSERFADRLAGSAALLMSVFLFLPIPFANGLPALSVILLALGLSERDGLWLGAGLATAVISTLVVIAMVTFGAAIVGAVF